MLKPVCMPKAQLQCVHVLYVWFLFMFTVHDRCIHARVPGFTFLTIPTASV